MAAVATAEHPVSVELDPLEGRIETLWREPGSTTQTYSTPHTTAGLRDVIPGITLYGSWGHVGFQENFDGVVSRTMWPAGLVAPVISAAPQIENRAITKHVLSSLFEWLGHQPVSSNSFALAHAAAMFIRRLQQADSPTPQIGSNGAGGIEVEWLVGGISLTVDVASESEILIYAVDNANRELFSKEITSRWSTNDEIFDQAAELLKELAGRVDAPAPLRS